VLFLLITSNETNNCSKRGKTHISQTTLVANQIAIIGAKAAPIIPAKLKVKEAPEYRTAVGNNSDKKVPKGP
jgi:hypothetical protein